MVFENILANADEFTKKFNAQSSNSIRCFNQSRARLHAAVSLPVEIPEAGKLVDLDGMPEPGEVNGVQLLLDEGEVVPDQAGLDDLLLICCPHKALARAE